MSNETNTWPHQDLINDNKIDVAQLKPKTQDLIKKFSALTDNDAKEAMDEKIYGDIEDFLEEKATAEKAAKTKENIAKHKKNKMDVSSAATAKTPEQIAAEKAAAEKAAAAGKKEGGLMNFVFGRK